MKHIELIKSDYQDALSFVDKCDEHIFRIRNWALVSASAVIAFAISSERDGLVFVNFVIVVCFMYFELVYKSLQNDAARYANRVAQLIQKYIEKPSSKKIAKEYRFGFGKELQYPSIKLVFHTISNPRQKHILAFYFLLIFCSIGAYFLDGYIT